MAKQRVINTHFWDDSFIVNLDPIEKLLFLYLLTNPLTDIAGAYEINVRRIAFDTGIDREMVLKVLQRFESADKIIYREGWILITNFIKNQVRNPKVKVGIERSLNNCPDWVKDRLSIGYQSVSKPIVPNLTKPNLTKPIGETPQAATKRGSRIPDPFLLTAEMREWATSECPQIDLKTETQKFVNYWRAKTGKDATKLDWPATWQNWLLNSRDRYGTNRQIINGDKPTSVSRLQQHKPILSEYPTEEELGRIS